MLTFVVTACDRASSPAPAPEPAPSAYAAAGDLSGYYRPVTPVRLGDWGLEHLFLAQPADFRRPEGGADVGPSSPVTLRFARASGAGPAADAVSRDDTVRVLATRYSVTDARVRFEGRSPELGRVAFDGRLDQGALATARRNLGSGEVVLTGTLIAGGQTARDVRLTWSMGD